MRNPHKHKNTMPNAQKTPRIITGLEPTFLPFFKILLITIAAMDKNIAPTILSTHARTLSHVHAYSHTFPRRHFINSPTFSPSSLVTASGSSSSSSYKIKTSSFKLAVFNFITNSAITTATSQQQEEIAETMDAEKLRLEFLQVLGGRRTPEVPLTVEPGKPVKDPLYQETPRPTPSPVMESCPKKDIPNLKELLKEENFYLTTEAGEQGRLPVLILSLKESSPKKRPAVVFLHSTNKCKEWLRPLLEAYASRGYITVAIDSRYHGERARNMTTYRDALVSSWEKGDTMPFIFDTVWDLIKLADYLTQREDIDPFRLGITGESLGGMHAWFAGAVDTRYTVVVPIIGVQGFRWAIEHDKWQARVDSIKAVFEKARIDLGKSAIDKEVVEKVWDRIAPGLASKFDSPYTIPIIAPRPLLIVNGAEDPRCPLLGLEIPKSRVEDAYEKANTLDSFKFVAEPGIPHQMTSLMLKEASDWFDRFLMP